MTAGDAQNVRDAHGGRPWWKCSRDVSELPLLIEMRLQDIQDALVNRFRLKACAGLDPVSGTTRVRSIVAS